MFVMPQWPSIRRCHVRRTPGLQASTVAKEKRKDHKVPMPRGVTSPKPVTTTLRIACSDGCVGRWRAVRTMRDACATSEATVAGAHAYDSCANTPQPKFPLLVSIMAYASGRWSWRTVLSDSACILSHDLKVPRARFIDEKTGTWNLICLTLACASM